MYIRGEISTGRRGSVGAMREHRNAEDLIIDSIAKKQRVADGQIKKSSGFLKFERDGKAGWEAGQKMGVGTCRLVRSQRICSMLLIVSYSGLDWARSFALIFTRDDPRRVPPKQSPGL